MKSSREIESIVLFGGGGLVGYQIARLCAKHLNPTTVVICALTKDEAEGAVLDLKREFPSIKNIIGEYGNLFVREEYANAPRKDLVGNDQNLTQLYKDVYGEINKSRENISEQNLMGKIIHKYRPTVVVDCVNTATAISYQDVKSSSIVVKDFRDALASSLKKTDLKKSIAKASTGDKEALNQVLSFAKEMDSLMSSPLELFPDIDNLKMIDLLIVSQSVPQLVRHVTLLYQAMVDAKTQVYVKVGTTGTGGMGVNIPFTHGEDKPSFTLMAKSAVGFAHTGLLFLLARSPGPIIKEIKPGAMIGYKRVDSRNISKFRKPVKSFESKQEKLGSMLQLRRNESEFNVSGQVRMVGIDTGENGFFTRGEFEAITYLDSMEFVTPEEIARNVLYEILGDNTGKDVISAIDGSVMDPSYRGGFIRQAAIDQMKEIEKNNGELSIAIGELGPPQLSKLLYEAHLIKKHVGTIAELAKMDVSVLSSKIAKDVQGSEIGRMITSLGLVILLPSGDEILRGPSMNIPESKVYSSVEIKSKDEIDSWAKQGWIDLRPSNFEVWKKRAKKIFDSWEVNTGNGSSSFNPENYTRKEIEPGEIVGWILGTEFGGARIK